MTVSRPVVPLLVPDLPDRHALWPYLQRMDDARQYSNFGPLASELEHALAARFSAHAGAPVFVTAVGSATLGLELTLASLALRPGSRILVPAFTFIATATAVIRAGHVPVIADIDEGSWLLTPEIAASAFASAAGPCDAVLPVAAFGQPVAPAAWRAFSARHGVPVLIDAAGAFGSQWTTAGSGRLPGEGAGARTASLAVVFSLHTTKSLPAGEGGLVVSSDAALIAQVRQRSNFGINLDATRRVPVGMTDMVGTNAKLSEYHAAVGLASLARWEERAVVRRAVMQRYREALHAASGGRLVWQAGVPVAAPTLLCVRWPGPGMADELERVCAAQGVMTRRWYQPLIHHHPLSREGRAEHLATPVADALTGELVGLPFFPDLNAEQIRIVAECISMAARAAGRAARLLPRSSSPLIESTTESLTHGHGHA